MASYRLITAQLLLICLVLFLTGCGGKEQKSYPADYLLAQRAYPHGLPEPAVYEAAMAWRNKQRQTAQKNADGRWESLGPLNMSGRITDIELHPDDDRIVYAGSASGGIYLSENGGVDWTPIFDESNSLSIGDIAISETDPDIIYAGTGEANAGGGSIAYDGDGIYRSSDGGRNWTATGPARVGSIGKLCIDPADNNRVFAACMGQLFRNNEERGVYRTVDGGLNWERVLFLSDSTGAIDLAMHPTDGNIIYAAMWERVRRPDRRQYGGRTSGIFKSTDGGENWVELVNGLPQDGLSKGRIGLAMSESQPSTLYAWYADRAGNIQGIYRTDDSGASWQEKSTEGISGVSFMWWFGKIFVDPYDAEKVYATSLNMFYSEDGAESWQQIFTDAHVDHHAMALSALTEGLVYNGNDGGVYKSPDYGLSQVSYLPGMANYQFYTCTIDPVDPSVIYGGAQDNGINVSRGNSTDWKRLFGGDGFSVLVDPDDNEQIYFTTQYGNIFRSDTSGNMLRFGAIGIFGSFNWNAPLAMDPFDSHVIYTGTQRLFRSENKTESWEVISEQLTETGSFSGNINFGTITQIAISPLDNSIIYVGCDDGNVWVSTDYGENFSAVKEGIPRRWVTSIQADPHTVSGVYLCVSGFRFGESDSQVFYSANYGADWQSIAGNLPDIPANDIIADPDREGQLYLATDIGVYMTQDRGLNWEILGADQVPVPVLDIDYNRDERFLVAASYGRGMYRYKMEDLSADSRLSTTELRVFPNPASGILFVDGALIPESLELYSLAGRPVRRAENRRKLSLDGLVPGLYLLHIKLKKGSQLIKITVTP